MADKHFIGLIQSLPSAPPKQCWAKKTALWRGNLARDGAMARRTAERSLQLLTMLQTKTLGNLNELERDALNKAQKTVRDKLEQFDRAN